MLKKAVIIQWNVWKKDLLLLATKLIVKKADPSNAKEYYNSYLKEKKNAKLVKGLKIIIQQLKATENPNIVDIKSVIIEHPKTSHKLTPTIRQAKKVCQVGFCKSSNSSLNRESNYKKN